MAGTIIISTNHAWLAGSIAFATIVEGTWDLASREEQAKINAAYQPMHEGLQILAVDDLDDACFCLFYRKCAQALREYMASWPDDKVRDDRYDGMLERWHELLNELRNDARFDAIACDVEQDE